jgi:bifunctional DNase/RNase
MFLLLRKTTNRWAGYRFLIRRCDSSTIVTDVIAGKPHAVNSRALLRNKARPFDALVILARSECPTAAADKIRNYHDQEDHDEDEEQKFRNAGSCTRNSSKAEYARNYRDD